MVKDHFEEESIISDASTGGNETNENLNNFDEEIVISEIVDSNKVGSGTEIVVPSVEELEDNNLENDSDVGSSLFGFSSFIVPGSNENEIAGTRLSCVFGAIGLVAAAVVALGAKIYHDKSEEDEDDEIDSVDLDFGSSLNTSYSNNKDILKMKKKIFDIGGDE